MLKEQITKSMPLTLGKMIEIAECENVRVVDVILEEAQLQTGKNRDQVLYDVLDQFQHNFMAVEEGLTTNESVLMGSASSDLNNMKGFRLIQDEFVDKALLYTLAAQSGNHAVGMRPCAGTGDSCPYTGFLRAMKETGYQNVEIAEVAALFLKIGSMFRVGKTGTGCNMEGFGAGSAATAAATAHLYGGSPRDIERAMVIAISPTIAVPCTPRVMVPALCATHIGGAILIGRLAAGLAVNTRLEVNVPIDVMLAMASQVHPISAKYVVPTVVEFMQPFFKRKDMVEALIEEEVKSHEEIEITRTLEKANEIAKQLAKGAKPITETLGEAVVGGSSQAVGSPTNAGRIVHELSKGEIKKVEIELYPELFARRGINVPGILMGAIEGASTSDGIAYKQIMEKVKKADIEVVVSQIQEYQAQKITVITDQGEFSIDTLNRGGARLVIKDAKPSRDEAIAIAQRLGIVLVEE